MSRYQKDVVRSLWRRVLGNQALDHRQFHNRGWRKGWRWLNQQRKLRVAALLKRRNKDQQ